MSRPTVRRSPKPAALRPRVKVWLEADGRYAFGLGLSDILQGVERTGSIKQAAAALGKSYRYVWGRLKAAERVLGRQLVETHVGGQGSQRSALTPDGRRLITAFLALRSRMGALVLEEFTRHFG